MYSTDYYSEYMTVAANDNSSVNMIVAIISVRTSVSLLAIHICKSDHKREVRTL
jgi:hypothetical protein